MDINIRKKLINRLEKRIFYCISGCWIWTGAISSYSKRNLSYGRLQISKGKFILTHRLSYILHKGDIQNGLFVCHTCDNPSCINPDHLFLGTGRDNQRDMRLKKRGRGAIGEKNFNSKLTADDVREIRRLYAETNTTHVKLSLMYSVSPCSITNIINRKHWAHVTDA